MSDLPIIEPPSQPSRLKPSLAAICRCLLCVAVAAGLRAVTETGNATGESNETLTPVDMEVLSGFP